MIRTVLAHESFPHLGRAVKENALRIFYMVPADGTRATGKATSALLAGAAVIARLHDNADRIDQANRALWARTDIVLPLVHLLVLRYCQSR